ncbi:MAG TPA: response regulator, partial [Chloroflexota bacterium]|nr:response regulator [Chloroflexota bacterium]
DIRLPGPSGFEVLRQVKQNSRLRLIPVVMLTSSELPADVLRAYELGANGYISKLSYEYDLPTVLSHTMLYWTAMTRVSS